MEKNIHFANTPICQSCGMPLTAPEQFGKNADGTTNGDYCVYCCPNGEANMTGTLEERLISARRSKSSSGLFPDEKTAETRFRAISPRSGVGAGKAPPPQAFARP